MVAIVLVVVVVEKRLVKAGSICGLVMTSEESVLVVRVVLLKVLVLMPFVMLVVLDVEVLLVKVVATLGAVDALGGVMNWSEVS